VSPEDAARAVVQAAWDAVAELARETAAEIGWHTSECTVYAYGGNGPLFVTAVADRIGARNARFFRFGSVYSAYGSAISDVVHVYESGVSGRDHLAVVERHLADEAQRDLRGEGFNPAGATYEWELRSATGVVRAVATPPTDLAEELDGEPTFTRLTARYPLPRLNQPDATANGSAGPSGTRNSSYGANGLLPTYDEAAVVGTSIDGPLLVDGGSYTWLTTTGWTLTTDARGDASLTRK
jgi:acetophenone carboxylase